jgi:hypothetical protein
MRPTDEGATEERRSCISFAKEGRDHLHRIMAFGADPGKAGATSCVT